MLFFFTAYLKDEETLDCQWLKKYNMDNFDLELGSMLNTNDDSPPNNLKNNNNVINGDPLTNNLKKTNNVINGDSPSNDLKKTNNVNIFI